MGKVDPGVVAFWLANHIYGKPLTYFGTEGVVCRCAIFCTCTSSLP